MGNSRFCTVLASLWGRQGLALLLHPRISPSLPFPRLLGLIRVILKPTCSQEMLPSLPE